jgi:hypothetical protein
VKALAEHLSYDLRSIPAISVHLLVPGMTWTGMLGSASGRDKYPGAWWPSQVADLLEERVRERQFWVLCPDNEVTEDMDRKRMLWSGGDILQGRPPLSRWRDEYKDEFEAHMKSA